MTVSTVAAPPLDGTTLLELLLIRGHPSDLREADRDAASPLQLWTDCRTLNIRRLIGWCTRY
jgi:hypothetical protein